MTVMPSSSTSQTQGPAWLQSPLLWLVVLVLAALPLALPPVAPLTDLSGHLGRYAVQIDHGKSADLAQWYSFQWNLIPNLGVDLLVEWLSPYLGLEPSVRLVATAIPVLQVLGILCLSRSVHGRITPLALFALPLAYSYPLHYGFVNFALGQALATLALALWIFMGRRASGHSGWLVARWIVFLPIATGLWVCHLVAWALLCLFAAAHDLNALFRRGCSVRGLVIVAVGGLCLIAPYLVRLLWPAGSAGHGDTHDFFMPLKLFYPIMPLRDRWMVWDVLGALLLLGLIVWGWLNRPTDTASDPASDPGQGLLRGTMLLAVIYAVMPGTIFGSGRADMRLVPIILIVALVAMAPVYRKFPVKPAALAAAGAAFVLARFLGNAVALWLTGHAMAADLVALDSVARGSRVASIVVEPCTVSLFPWQRERRTHLGGYAIARRHAFSNEQWIIPGGQLLQVHAPLAGEFATDDSEIAKPDGCNKPNTLTNRLAVVPHAAFDYIWIIGDGKMRAVPGTVPVTQTPGSVLYRIVKGPA